jgi:lipopolysaccharide biosynthesis protein
MQAARRRIALFAHYDRDGIVDDYVLYYLRGLARVAERILFVSDCELRAGEAAKLEGLAELVFAGRHCEYDFGSWKRGFAHLNYDLSGWDEVIVANDSCYAPVFPFEDAFERMDRNECGFWGPTASQKDESFDHLNSYFMVFRRPILSDPAFLDFWRRVTIHEKKTDVINTYEIGVSHLLTQLGYKGASLVPMSRRAFFLQDRFLRLELPKFRLSWIKVNIFRNKPHRFLGLSSGLAASGTSYPRQLIEKHLLRMFNGANPSRSRFFFGEFLWAPGGGRVLALRGKINKRGWWKFYTYLCGVPVFALAVPGRQRRKP